jgi:hypothetical protein
MRTKPEERELSAALYDFYDHEETMKEAANLMQGFLRPSSTGMGVGTSASEN